MGQWDSSRMIKKGDSVPSVAVKLINNSGSTDADSATILGEGRVVLFTVPGAFTPTCHSNHLPGYVEAVDAFRAKGVSRIICATVNDQHVVKAWAASVNALGAVEFIADGNADLAKALELDVDLSGGGMGTRIRRAALIINNGVVESVFTENQQGQVTSSGAPAILEALESMPS